MRSVSGGGRRRLSGTIDEIQMSDITAAASEKAANEARRLRLKIRFHLIMRQWHPTKNGSLQPTEVTVGSGKKVWWICEKGHEWQTVVASRTYNGAGCACCSGRKVTPERNLAILHPGVAAQWHPTKNGSLRPADVAAQSYKKVWWLGTSQKCRHEWQARINSRTGSLSRPKGRGCPYCSGKVATSEHCLAASSPELVKEWHPTKNGRLLPTEVTAGSHRKVWWCCRTDHEWQVSVASRAYGGAGCPFCSGRKASAERNVAILHPEVAAQWHPTKNGSLRPMDVTPGARRQVWWRCENGHDWQASVSSRTCSGTGCQFCSGHKASAERNLAILYPDVAAQWHPTKNGSLRPVDVTPGAGRKVWWRCENGHDWRALVTNRRRGSGCPYCAGKRRFPAKGSRRSTFRPKNRPPGGIP